MGADRSKWAYIYMYVYINCYLVDSWQDTEPSNFLVLLVNTCMYMIWLETSQMVPTIVFDNWHNCSKMRTYMYIRYICRVRAYWPQILRYFPHNCLTRGSKLLTSYNLHPDYRDTFQLIPTGEYSQLIVNTSCWFWRSNGAGEVQIFR